MRLKSYRSLADGSKQAFRQKSNSNGQVRQGALTVITNVIPGKAEALPAIIEAAGSEIRFDNVRSLHYAALVVLPAVADHPSRLVLETNFDGDLSEHLKELIEHGAKGFDSIYRSCEGYPARGALQDSDAVGEYFKAHSVPATAFFVAFPGRTRDDILNAISVYNEAKTFLDRPPPLDKLSRDEVWERLVDHFRSITDPTPLRSSVTQTSLKWQIARNVAVGFIPGVIFLLLLPLLLIMARFQERREEARPEPPRRYHTDPAVAYKYLNLGRQNHMCTFATVKRGWFRAFMLKLGLLVTSILAGKIFLLGQLDTITTIHFARWILIDGGKRVVFLSNYNGTWSSYSDDFSDPPHLNAIWSNTERFPPAWFLLWQGAYNIQPYEDHTVEEFQPTYFFHRPYGDHSVQNILRYLEFRDALARSMG